MRGLWSVVIANPPFLRGTRNLIPLVLGPAAPAAPGACIHHSGSRRAAATPVPG